jgi:hypothetical protein
MSLTKTNALRLAVALACTPFATAQANTSGGFRTVVSSQPAPNVLSAQEKAIFTAIYDTIRAEKWDEAARMIDAAPQSPMSAMARAELFIAPNSPKVEAEQLQALLEAAPYLPQAEQLATMARKRGLEMLPERPGIRRFSWLGGAPKRDLPANKASDSIRAELQVFIKNDQPFAAELFLRAKHLNCRLRRSQNCAIVWLGLIISKMTMLPQSAFLLLHKLLAVSGVRRPVGYLVSPLGGSAIMLKPITPLIMLAAWPITMT